MIASGHDAVNMKFRHLERNAMRQSAELDNADIICFIAITQAPSRVADEVKHERGRGATSHGEKPAPCQARGEDDGRWC